MKKNIYTWLSLICNALIVIFVAISMVGFFVGNDQGNMIVSGKACFKYYTIDSNLLCAFCSIVVIVYDVMILSKKKTCLPKYAYILKFVGTACLTLTFLTVVCFLGIVMGYGPMFAGNNIFLHLACPILAIMSFTCLEHCETVKKHNFIYGLLPTLIYGIIYGILVLVTKSWEDFYQFNRSGYWYIAMLIMLVADIFICMAVLRLNMAINKTTPTKQNEIKKINNKNSNSTSKTTKNSINKKQTKKSNLTNKNKNHKK